jgi:3-hydroxyisobutyrate dehydrogenase-like beta-hydroxyacid dehydrogenase
VTMVTDAVVSIAADQGALEALPRGGIRAQMSTIGIAGIARCAALVDPERPDVALVDAPVSGSEVPAEQGRLTIFASGSRRGPCSNRAAFRCAGTADSLGWTAWRRLEDEAREQHVACVQG